ncbi:MAG TPA: family 78 glycoside hydrolase catalytic domain [Acidobacteriaceae bacterium]
MKSAPGYFANQLVAVFSLAVTLLLAIALSDATAFAAPPQLPPGHLRCEELENPLGIDTPQPRLSWQLVDPHAGALQTAYEIQVASSREQLLAGHANIWDSGRVESDRSVAVAYAGPSLDPEHRYFWRVRVWDQDGAAYPMSAIAWWETGLMGDAWHAQWIGYEERELRSIRESRADWISNRGLDNYRQSGDTHHDFRFAFGVDHPVRFAHLYVTGEDTAAAWINGESILLAEPLPPYKQTAWKRYVERDATAALKQGNNLLAVDVTLFDIGDSTPGGNASRTPMSACLYVRYQDGSDQVIVSNRTWKATLNATGSWFAPSYDDASWPHAIRAESQGQFTGPLNARPWPTNPVMMMRREFAVPKPIRTARLYATALGSYRFWIDGHPIGDQILAPGWTDYRERVPYQTYDVTGDLRAGNNTIGAYLAPGWYTTPLEWTQEPYNYGNTPPALRSELHIVYQDGSDAWIVTGSEWKAAPSPIEKAEIYDGETYDARLEQPGWAMPRFNDASWYSVQTIEPIDTAIVAEEYQPIRIEITLRAKALTEPKPGVYVYDFGQNMAGFAHLHAEGKVGTKIRLRFAEVLNPDGTIYTENLRTALATDYYTMAGRGDEDYEPSFTFHGFRYVELTGLPAKPDISAVTAKVIHTAAPFHTQLATGSSMLNQLWSNILWGQRSNFVGVPSDCPQRDERLGWTGDAEVFWRTASYNMGLAPFSRKFAADLRGTQVGTPMYGIYAPGTSVPNAGFGAGWSDAGVIIPWTSWLQSGDTRIIDQNWVAMSTYLGAVEHSNPGFLWEHDAGIPFGDWLSPEGQTKAVLVQTAYWAYDVSRMEQMARATGRTADEQKYAALFGNIQKAFAAAFVRNDGFIAGADNGPSPFGRIFVPNKVPSGDTQTGYVLALYMHLVPDSLRGAAANRLVQRLQENGWRLGTGFLGTPYLLAVLADTGHADVAWRLLLSTEYPSWGYLVTHGATTMWERWNADKMRGDPSMNSYNHYAYGAVADWIYRYAAGIDADALDAGFHTIRLHPNFDAKLGSLNFTFDSPYGPIHSSWTVHGSNATWDLTVPPNASGQLDLSRDQQGQFALNGAPLSQSPDIRAVTSPGGSTTWQIPAGTWHFTVALKDN